MGGVQQAPGKGWRWQPAGWKGCSKHLVRGWRWQPAGWKGCNRHLARVGDGAEVAVSGGEDGEQADMARMAVSGGEEGEERTWPGWPGPVERREERRTRLGWPCPDDLAFLFGEHASPGSGSRSVRLHLRRHDAYASSVPYPARMSGVLIHPGTRAEQGSVKGLMHLPWLSGPSPPREDEGGITE